MEAERKHFTGNLTPQDEAKGDAYTRMQKISSESSKLEARNEALEERNLNDHIQSVSQDELVDLLLQKSKKAFERLYDDYSAALYGLAYKILKEEELAEDALQETFVRIWRKIHTYDSSKGRLFTWMLNISRNICIDMLRANESRKTSQTSSIEDFSFDQKGPSTSTQVEHIGLREIVDGLPQEQQFVIDLIYFKGYTQAEVAEEFNIPLGTVKSRVRLAMNHLRARIG
jgi:RNA polymerase sigma factor (sigma-70 family)